MGIAAPVTSGSLSPMTSADETTLGSMAAGISSTLRSSLSQFFSWMLKSRVLDAFVKSVAWIRPLVSLAMIHASMVPNAMSPARALALRPGIWSRSHFTLVPEKYASTTRPVLSRNRGSRPSDLSSSQMDADLLHCQTMALWTGFSVFLSHRTTVSRWFVMPMAIMSLGCTEAASSAFFMTVWVVSQMTSGSCSTQPG